MMTFARVLMLVSEDVLRTGLTFLALWLLRRLSQSHAQASPGDSAQPVTGKGKNAFSRFWHASWLRNVGRRIALIGGSVVVNGPYASFATAQSVLHHVDPLVCRAVQMTLLLPVSALLLFCSRHTWQVARIRDAHDAGSTPEVSVPAGCGC